jgi:hypothetical protein
MWRIVSSGQRTRPRADDLDGFLTPRRVILTPR